MTVLGSGLAAESRHYIELARDIAVLQAEATSVAGALARVQSIEAPLSQPTPTSEALSPQIITITLDDLLLSQARLAQAQGDLMQDIDSIPQRGAGTYSYTLPTGMLREEVWIGYPQGWLVELAGVQESVPRVQAWFVWRQLSAADEVISLLPETIAKALYTFSGFVYFQGFETPEQATIRLIKCDLSNSSCESVAAPVTVDKPPYTAETIEPASFNLTYEATEQNAYRIVIEVPGGGAQLEWLVGSLPENVTKTETNTVTIATNEFGPQTIPNIQFGGPLPILLDYTEARSGDIPYDPANLASPWIHEDRPSDYPYMTRTDEGRPSALWVEWPLWLPANEALNLHVLLPGTNEQSARATYNLIANEEALWTSEPLQQCPMTEASELAAGPITPTQQDDFATVRIMDSDEVDDCGDFRTRLAIWRLRLGR